jgi:formylglycine-generating enzyme required for sulfatase activity
MLDLVTLMVDNATGTAGLPSVSVILLVTAVASLVLVLLWKHRAGSPRRSTSRHGELAAVLDEAEANAHSAIRNAPARLPMPRVTVSDLEPSTSVEAVAEEAHNASSASASSQMHMVAGGAAPGTEPRGSSRKTSSSEYTLEGRDLKEMVFIPAGDFWMGSDDKDENEKPMHKVQVEAFYIDKYPVTNAEFARFVEATGYTTEAEEANKGWIWQSEWREVTGACWRRPTGPGSTVDDKMDHPAVLISWNDARAYCHWAGKRLPTEAEWEKAARGTDARKWPWGNEWDPTRLNSGERGHGTTTPVGYYQNGVSFYGVCDMAGNVWEWVDEWYKPYPGSPCKDEDFGEKYRILRGGSWDSFGHNARCANRTRNLARACVNVNGFRCVLPVNKSERARTEKQYEIFVPMKRLLPESTTTHIEIPMNRIRAKAGNGSYDRSVPPHQIVEMGRSQIEVLHGRDPFLFRSGRKAYSVQEVAWECLQDPEAGKYHLRTGHFTQYLKFLGWQSPGQPENIARSYYPTRDLPYYLALVLEYSRQFCMGLQILPPSEEVLDAIVVDRGLTSLLIRKAEVIVNPRDYAEMVFIPEGEFKMGASESQVEEALELARFRHPKAVKSWFADEAPMMNVRTEAYLIDKYPVTNEQFEKFVEASSYKPAGDWRKFFAPGRENHPVVNVSWEDAMAYAKWADKRLPGEAEWEKAARGVDGRKYSWGNRWDATRLNSLEKGPRTTTPVGFYPEGASPYGVMDCLGNVWEWTADPYRAYPQSEHRSDKYGDKYRVFRGGSWNNFQYNNRCSNRHREEPTYTCMSHGFRCARSVTPSDLRRQRPS